MQGASLGLELAVSVVLLAFVGYKVDEFLKTTPWGIFVGVVLGSIVGMWNIYKEANNIK